jgi:hypothetical protein
MHRQCASWCARWPCWIPTTSSCPIIFDGCQLLLPTLEEHFLVHLQPSPDAIVVSIHALTQEVIREHLMGDARAPMLEAVIAALAAQMDTFDASQLRRKIDGARVSEEVAACCMRMGSVCRSLGKYEEALQHQQRALELKLEFTATASCTRAYHGRRTVTSVCFTTGTREITKKRYFSTRKRSTARTTRTRPTQNSIWLYCTCSVKR